MRMYRRLIVSIATAAAVFGELHPGQAANLKIRQRVYLAELDVEQLLEAKSRRQIKSVPRFPSVRRDFSLLLAKGTQYGEVHKTIAGIGIVVVIIRTWGGLPEGVMYAILLMNALVPFINRVTQPRVFGTRTRTEVTP